MPSLIDVLEVLPSDTDDEPEDIFASAPGLIFTDDLVNLHGGPDATIIYKSARFGNLVLRTATQPAEEERKLFSHYLWNAGLKLANLISNDTAWSVKDEAVVELGSGVGLSGIVATLAGAEYVGHDLVLLD
jgi:nicotinamide N-methyltransferase